MRYDEAGRVIGPTIVSARWLVDRDGKLRVTLALEANAGDLEVAFAEAG